MVEVRFPGYACMYRFVKTFKAAGRKKTAKPLDSKDGKTPY